MTDRTFSLLTDLRDVRTELYRTRRALRDARAAREKWRQRAFDAEWACGVRTRKEKAGA